MRALPLLLLACIFVSVVCGEKRSSSPVRSPVRVEVPRWVSSRAMEEYIERYPKPERPSGGYRFTMGRLYEEWFVNLERYVRRAEREYIEQHRAGGL